MPVIVETAREIAAKKVAAAINSCATQEQCETAQQLVNLFYTRYDQQQKLPFNAWLLNKRFELSNPSTWSQLCNK